MLPSRTALVLRRIVEQYVESAAPVASQALADELKVSSATVRNEMAHLEQEGYVMRPHTSAGSVPVDKGYRFYVENLGETKLPETEERLISHLFHQVEREIESWLSLTASLLARSVKNMALVTPPQATGCKLKHIEVVSLQERRALIVLVLQGAVVKQKLISFQEDVHQPVLTAASQRLSDVLTGLGTGGINKKELELSPLEQEIRGHILEMMRNLDSQSSGETFMDGFHYIIAQPEFIRNDRIQPLVDLVETRKLLSVIRPAQMGRNMVHVIIGGENAADAVKDYSVVISQYGLPDEATGMLGVVGPTRMHYSQTIHTVAYLSTVLTKLMSGLYGQQSPREDGVQTGGL
ncbi:heat-inducible transcriptional repressor HrcA [Chloroflexota bacterium]